MKLILCMAALCAVLIGCEDKSESTNTLSDASESVTDASTPLSDVSVDADLSLDASDAETVDADLVFDALVFDVTSDVDEESD